MKIRFLISIVAFGLLCACAQGQVIIYKNKITLIRTGGGSTTKTKIAGFTVVNATNAAVTRIEANSSSRNFQVINIFYEFNSVRGSQGKEFSVFSEVDFYTDSSTNLVQDSETLKGSNVLVDIGAIETLQDWSIPKTMQVVGRMIYTSSLGQPTIDELTGTLSLDKKNTQDANALNLTFEEAVDRMKTMLRDQGYTQL